MNLKRAAEPQWARKTPVPPSTERRGSGPGSATIAAPPSGNGNGHAANGHATNGHAAANGNAAANGHGQPPPAAAAETQSQVGRRLSDFILAEGLITPDQFALVLAEQKKTNEKLATVVVRLGLMTEEQMMHAQSLHYRIPSVKFPEAIPAEILRMVPAAIARKYEVLPIGRSAGALTLAMVDPTNLSAVDDVAFRTGMRVFPVICLPALIRAAIDASYDQVKTGLASALSDAEAEVVSADDSRESMNPNELRASADQVPVVRLVNMILLEGIQRGASDIHLEPEEKTLHVRYRIDGVLQDVMTPAKRLEPAIVSRLKIMANLDIAERRLPQDGRIKFRDTAREVDFRVSMIPALFGESVVLRILDKSALKLDLTQLGFDGWSLEQFQKAIKSPHGMILVTGPTGSGKTTTLYSGLSAVNSPDVHILTLEDPVEYNLPRVNQVQVNDEIGLTFATALRSFLRHDPDVILVGEMRDQETAQIANRAALTGHLVLSTLHTNDAASTVARLLDMGIPPFLLASSLRLVVAQRLIRKVCEDCKQPYEMDEAKLVDYGYVSRGVGAVTLQRGRGCAVCSQTGLKGRVAIYEVMPVTREVKDLVLQGAPPMEICKVARDQGMKTLREAALAKLIDGVTTIEEVLRVTTE
jgi:type IV pilus assembly protein PilB